MITRRQRQQLLSSVEVPPQRPVRCRKGREPSQQPVSESTREVQMREKEIQDVQETFLRKIDEFEVQVRNGRNSISSQFNKLLFSNKLLFIHL